MFFVSQRTPYGIWDGLVDSEMCISGSEYGGPVGYRHVAVLLEVHNVCPSRTSLLRCAMRRATSRVQGA